MSTQIDLRQFSGKYRLTPEDALTVAENHGWDAVDLDRRRVVSALRAYQKWKRTGLRLTRR